MAHSFSRVLPFLICLAVLGGLNSVARAQDERLVKRVDEAVALLQGLMGNPETAIPQPVLGSARAVMVIQKIRSRLFFGGRGAEGIVIVRDDRTGAWSPVAFVQTGDEGWSSETEDLLQDAVYLLMDAQAVRLLTESRYRFGGRVSAEVGPLSSGSDYAPTASVLVYPLRAGLPPGQSVQTGAILTDTEANQGYYQNRSADMNMILYSGRISPTVGGENLASTLQGYIGSFRMTRKKRISAPLF